MKRFLSVFLLLIAVAEVSQACKQHEAQFSGTIKSIRSNSDKAQGGCLVKINFDEDNFVPHAMCPLNLPGVANSEILARKCDHKVGDSIATYLIYKIGQYNKNSGTNDPSVLYIED